MRALTVRQPWAWQILHQGKDVENRSRYITGDYRGDVLVHAAKVPDYAALRDLPGQPPPECTAPRLFDFGVVLGVVKVWAVHRAGVNCCPNRGARPFGSPWAQPDAWHLCLTNPRPLARPIPARGMLGLWRPADELVALVRDDLAAQGLSISPT